MRFHSENPPWLLVFLLSCQDTFSVLLKQAEC
jgi:hypothetical protein